MTPDPSAMGVIDDSCIRIAAWPTMVGYYWLGPVNCGTGFAMYHRPCWWHRLWMRLLLGFTWMDAK